MAKNSGIELEQVMEKEACIAYLEELIKCLRAGKLVIEQGGQVVSMSPPEVIDIEISAKRKEKKEKFALNLSWSKELHQETAAPITISQEEPETDDDAPQASDEGSSTFKL
jgi:amphi-Trp domain-containing protein